MKTKDPLRDSLTSEERQLVLSMAKENPLMSRARALDKINAERARLGIVKISKGGWNAEMRAGGLGKGCLKGYYIPKIKEQVEKIVAENFVPAPAMFEDERYELTENSKLALKWLCAGATWRQMRKLTQFNWDTIETVKTELLVMGIIDQINGRWHFIWTSDEISYRFPECAASDISYAEVMKLQQEEQNADFLKKMEAKGYVWVFSKWMKRTKAEKLLQKLQKIEAEQKREAELRARYSEENRDKEILLRIVDDCRGEISWSIVVRRHGWSYLQGERFRELALKEGLIKKVVPDNRYDDRYIVVS